MTKEDIAARDAMIQEVSGAIGAGLKDAVTNLRARKPPAITSYASQEVILGPELLLQIIQEAYPLLFENLPRDFVGDLEREGVALKCVITGPNYEQIDSEDFLVRLLITRKVDG